MACGLAYNIDALRYETDKRIETIKNTDNLTPSTGTLKKGCYKLL